MFISLKKLKDDYPFSVPRGHLKCELSAVALSDGTPCPYILFESRGIVYAVNDFARASGIYRDYQEIWRDRPQQPGEKVPMNKVMGLGLRLVQIKFPDVYTKLASSEGAIASQRG